MALAAIVLLGCWFAHATPAVAVDGAAVRPEQAESPGEAIAAPVAGMRVYVDPETGEFTTPPPPPAPPPAAATSEAPAALRARQVDGLVEEANPDGGYTINLKRRFFGEVQARVAGGTLEVECDTGDVPEGR